MARAPSGFLFRETLGSVAALLLVVVGLVAGLVVALDGGAVGAAETLANEIVATEVVATGFGWPATVAVRPRVANEADEAAAEEVLLYTPAAGRVLSITPEQEGSSTSIAARVPPREGGGVAVFLNPTTLLVAAASPERSQALMHVIGVGTPGVDEPAEPRAAVGPAVSPAEVILEPASADYAGLIATPKGVVAAIARQGGGRQVLRGRRLGGLVTGLQPFGVSPLVPPGMQPRGLALDGRGFAVAVLEGEGDRAGSGDSGARLVFFGPEPNARAKSIASLRLDLSGIRSLACSTKPTPLERRLYALAGDGVYRLDSAVDNIGEPYATGVRLFGVDRPGGMAFGAGGRLYITRAGADGDGELLRVIGEL